MKTFFLYGLAAASSLTAGVLFHLSSQYDFFTIDGDARRWSEFQGQWLVINYFAEWCAPCLKEVPELNQFVAEYDIPLFAISFDGETDGKMREIAAKYDMKFAIISADPAPKLPVIKPRALPTTYIINPDGVMEKKIEGQVTHEMLFEAIEHVKSL